LPRVHPTAFVHPAAIVVGDVILEARSSVWPGASLRGDLQTITVGECSNVQDNCVFHTTQGGTPTTLGKYVSVGHGAVVHSATVEDECLIGMHATVLDDVVVGRGSLVAAGTVIAPGTKIPPASLVMGVPGKVIKTDPSLRERCRQNAEHYLDYMVWHARGDFPVYRPRSATL
jgi:carbonic anhydrase/acetyltransferase-like protein (isoleucine patch superfamily)